MKKKQQQQQQKSDTTRFWQKQIYKKKQPSIQNADNSINYNDND